MEYAVGLLVDDRAVVAKRWCDDEFVVCVDCSIARWPVLRETARIAVMIYSITLDDYRATGIPREAVKSTGLRKSQLLVALPAAFRAVGAVDSIGALVQLDRD